MTEQPEVDSDVMSRLANHFAPEPAPEVAQPEAEAEQPAEIQADQTDDDTPEVEDEAGEELEIDGEAYKLPPQLAAKVKEWKEGALRQEDYTRKTQQVADLQRHVSMTAEALQTSQQFQQAIQPEQVELARVEADLARYKGVDWGSLDMDSYVKLRGQFDSLKERAGELRSGLQAKAQQFQQWQSSHKAQLAQAGEQYLSKAIPQWGQQAKQDAVSAAKAANFTEDELANVFDPRFVALAWKAAQFDKLQQAKAPAVSKAQKAPPVLKPGVSQGQTAASDKRYKDTRASLKKTGSVDDAARLLLMRSK